MKLAGGIFFCFAQLHDEIAQAKVFNAVCICIFCDRKETLFLLVANDYVFASVMFEQFWEYFFEILIVFIKGLHVLHYISLFFVVNALLNTICLTHAHALWYTSLNTFLISPL